MSDRTNPDAAASPTSHDPAASTSALVRSSSIVGAGTLLSRATGMLRTIALAAVLGGRTLAQGYNLANTTPNQIYDLLLGGVFSATLVPVFVDQLRHDDEDGTNAVVSVLASALILLTIGAMIFAPWIFRLYTWRADPAERAANIAVGVPLLRWFLPQILFYGLTALATAILNARRSYAAPAFAPALNNLVVLAMLGAFWRVGGTAPSAHEVASDPVLLTLLGAGTTAGIVVMALALWPALRSAGVRLRWHLDLRHRSVRQVFTLSGWTLAYTLVNQVALAIVLALAAGVEPDGQVTAYTYAFMIFQLPYGLFAVSLMTTFEPELARAASHGDMEGFRRQFATGLRLLLLVMVPSAVGCTVLARPIVNLLLQHGAYRASAAVTGDLLAWFAAGLVGFAVYLYTLRAFYALKDTRTPFFVNVIENTVNVAAAFALVGRWHAPGLAMAYTAAYAIAAVLAMAALRRRIGSFEGPRNTSLALRVSAAAGAMGAAVWAVLQVTGHREGFGAALPVMAGVAVGVAVFGGAVVALRVDEAEQVTKRLTGRLKGR